MVTQEEVAIRRATASDADQIVEFVVKNIGTTSPINMALEFEENDSRAAYEAKIRDGISEGLSLVVVDRSTQALLGCSIVTKWSRDNSKNFKMPFPETLKSQLYYNMLNPIAAEFWKLCPKDVNVVARGFVLLLLPEIRGHKIGAQLGNYLNDSFFEKNGLDGAAGVATSRSNYINSLKKGGVPLVEMEYEDYFNSIGLRFRNNLPDGTTKCCLMFKPTKKHANFKPAVVKMEVCASKL
ncbi:hypothetical protein L596_024231 [Steinernema carpocapsae]|uniref:N-acetyltransferase domain-containing protein n=1 Tax=Steinernema carpocapsae TaxID=34508 RepID=A0A4U5MG39_STECR|nr:hypothetical protein L596_024231 [Steinernema carpocapsae]